MLNISTSTGWYCKYHFISRKLGDEWTVKPQVIDEIEAFTCLMYGQAREKSVNAVRSIMLKKMVGEDEQLTTKTKVDLSRLPPCRDNLVPHIGRVNHRLAIYKRADKPIFWQPKPYDPGQGWEKNEDGTLEPVWSCGPIPPFPHWLSRKNCSGGGGEWRRGTGGRDWLLWASQWWGWWLDIE